MIIHIKTGIQIVLMRIKAPINVQKVILTQMDWRCIFLSWEAISALPCSLAAGLKVNFSFKGTGHGLRTHSDNVFSEWCSNTLPILRISSYGRMLILAPNILFFVWLSLHWAFVVSATGLAHSIQESREAVAVLCVLFDRGNGPMMKCTGIGAWNACQCA